MTLVLDPAARAKKARSAVRQSGFPIGNEKPSDIPLAPDFVKSFQRIIDSLPEQIALVDNQWDILAVNPAWVSTAAMYGYGDLEPGTNYLQFCQDRAAEGHSAAAVAVGGALEIASGAKTSFRYVYHGRDRWEGFAFQLCINRIEIEGRAFATITRYDVTELVKLRQLREDFSDLLIEGQTAERRRLARDLHDSTMQTLVALGLSMAELKRPHKPGDNDHIMREMSALLAEAQLELRTISYLAHPPVLRQMALPEALQALTEGFGRRTGLKVSLSVDHAIGADWRPAEIVLYRVVQEALSNIHRHARASEVLVRLQGKKHTLHAMVADNGIGISTHRPEGVGLPSMRARLSEHGGRLSIWRGSPGTIVIASVPRNHQLRAMGDMSLLH